MDRLVALGAAAQSVLRRSGTARYRVPISKNAPVKKGWTIVSAVDGSPQDAPGFQRGEVATYSESFNALQAVKRSNPTRARDLMLVRVKANDGA